MQQNSWLLRSLDKGERPSTKDPLEMHWSKLRTHKVVTSQRVERNLTTCSLELSWSSVAAKVLVSSLVSAHP